VTLLVYTYSTAVFIATGLATDQSPIKWGLFCFYKIWSQMNSEQGQTILEEQEEEKKEKMKGDRNK
jgi:hypothetical protein